MSNLGSSVRFLRGCAPPRPPCRLSSGCAGLGAALVSRLTRRKDCTP